MSKAPKAARKPPGKRRAAADTNDDPPAARQRNQRRALSHIGGAVTFRGADTELKSPLEAALRVSSDESETRAHLHGFHSYPARLHPYTARGTIEALSQPGQIVLDPFCGSGTVLLEAQLVGRGAVGTDINPLSVLLCQTKCTPTTRGQREHLLSSARKVVEQATERRTSKAGPTRQYPPEDRQWFDIHVLLELDGLRSGIEKIPEPYIRAALQLALTSIMTKLSRKPGDSARGEVRKRLASGYAIRTFERRVDELARQMGEFANALPGSPPQARVLQGDARKLEGIADSSIDLVVCSPPYPGVFDYLEHHQLRLRWLDLDKKSFERGEIGARRQMIKLRESAYSRWKADFKRVLQTLTRVLKPGGNCAMVMADSVVGDRGVFADDLIRALAHDLGLEVRAICSQHRPYFHQKTAKAFATRPRKEHLIVLRTDAGNARHHVGSRP